MLSMELFGDGFPLPEFPRLPAIKGLGLSDQDSYAGPLAKKFDYTNTFYDREPRLDITEAHVDRHGTYDFILSSDVFEHIAAPVERAFDEACKLLKPNGVLCLSVPFSLHESTIERFPGLHEFAVVDLAGSPVLVNRTPAGAFEVREDLVFHGGVGATLEMRLFSRNDLERKLAAAGFRNLSFQTEAVPRFGISFEGGWSLPLVARKQEFVFDKLAAGQLAGEYYAMKKKVDEVQGNVERCARHIEQLDAALAERGIWAAGIEQELEEAKKDLALVQAQFIERTQWALQVDKDLEVETRIAAGLRSELEAVAESRWVKLGNRLGVGPKVTPRA